jgi:hypothetical protein
MYSLRKCERKEKKEVIIYITSGNFLMKPAPTAKRDL